MARALIGAIRHTTSEDALTLSFDVIFYGNDLERADTRICAVTLPETATKAQARTAIRQAIAAEAAALGYSYQGVATLLPELFVGL